MTGRSNQHNISELISETDILIGAVLVVGKKAPNLITNSMLKTMKPKSVIIDVAVDQGGCVESCKPTTHSNPTYFVDQILHYCVSNMPGAVPYTSTIALTNATLPYVKELANKGYTSVIHGKLNHEETKSTFSRSRKYGPTIIVENIQDVQLLCEFIQKKRKNNFKSFKIAILEY